MNNPPAFPTLHIPYASPPAWSGMSLRDYFAAQAMLARGFTVRPYDTTHETAKDCYAMADAMLKAREQ